jgi:hypothetical protein
VCVSFIVVIIIIMASAAMIVGVTARISVSPVSIISGDDDFGFQMVGFFGIPRTVRLVGVQREFNQP